MNTMLYSATVLVAGTTLLSAYRNRDQQGQRDSVAAESVAAAPHLSSHTNGGNRQNVPGVRDSAGGHTGMMGHDTRDSGDTLIRIPESVRAEHQEIYAELMRATKAPGSVGAAARALATLLHPHFVREEQIALPPLGLVAPLARHELTPAMRKVLPMTDSLRAELPHMLAEHTAIRAATMRLGRVAQASGDARVGRLAEQLMLHARSEEEVFYPAALLVGDLVRTGLPLQSAP